LQGLNGRLVAGPGRTPVCIAGLSLGVAQQLVPSDLQRPGWQGATAGGAYNCPGWLNCYLCAPVLSMLHPSCVARVQHACNTDAGADQHGAGRWQIAAHGAHHVFLSRSGKGCAGRRAICLHKSLFLRWTDRVHYYVLNDLGHTVCVVWCACGHQQQRTASTGFLACSVTCQFVCGSCYMHVPSQRSMSTCLLMRLEVRLQSCWVYCFGAKRTCVCVCSKILPVSEELKCGCG